MRGAGPELRTARTTQDPEDAGPRGRRTQTTQDPNDNDAGALAVWVLRRLGLAPSGSCAVWVLRCLGLALSEPCVVSCSIDDVVECLDCLFALSRWLGVSGANAEHGLEARRARRLQLGVDVGEEEELVR